MVFLVLPPELAFFCCFSFPPKTTRDPPWFFSSYPQSSLSSAVSLSLQKQRETLHGFSRPTPRARFLLLFLFPSKNNERPSMVFLVLPPELAFFCCFSFPPKTTRDPPWFFSS